MAGEREPGPGLGRAEPVLWGAGGGVSRDTPDLAEEDDHYLADQEAGDSPGGAAEVQADEAGEGQHIVRSPVDEEEIHVIDVESSAR